MQRTHLNTFLWGLLLLVAGVAGLLYNFGVFADYEQLAAYIVAGLLAFAGLSFACTDMVTVNVAGQRLFLQGLCSVQRLFY